MSKYQRQIATWQRIESRHEVTRKVTGEPSPASPDGRRQSRRYDGIQRGAQGRGVIGQYV